jgi:hypothetical protein
MQVCYVKSENKNKAVDVVEVLKQPQPPLIFGRTRYEVLKYFHAE